jgi:hypothetical protein
MCIVATTDFSTYLLCLYGTYKYDASRLFFRLHSIVGNSNLEMMPLSLNAYIVVHKMFFGFWGVCRVRGLDLD